MNRAMTKEILSTLIERELIEANDHVQTFFDHAEECPNCDRSIEGFMAETLRCVIDSDTCRPDTAIYLVSLGIAFTKEHDRRYAKR